MDIYNIKNDFNVDSLFGPLYDKIPKLSDVNNDVMNSIIQCIMITVPDAIVYGKYVSNYLLGISEITQQVEILVKNKSSAIKIINILRVNSYLANNSEDIENNPSIQIRKLSDNILQYCVFLKIYGRFPNLIISIKIIPDLNRFISQSLKMNNNYSIDILNNKELPLYDKKGLNSLIINKSTNVFDIVVDHVINRKLELVHDWSKVRDCFITNNSYLYRLTVINLINDSIESLERGWILNEFNFGFSIYLEKESKCEDCSICIDNLAIGRSIILHNCSHKFHVDCIQKHMLEIGPSHSKCPNCRTNIHI